MLKKNLISLGLGATLLALPVSSLAEKRINNGEFHIDPYQIGKFLRMKQGDSGFKVNLKRCSMNNGYCEYALHDLETGAFIADGFSMDLNSEGILDKVHWDFTHIEKVPRFDLIQLGDANLNFEKDMEDLESRLGINFFSFDPRPIEKRVTSDFRESVLSISDSCDLDGIGGYLMGGSSESRVEVPIVEYTPGRSQYPERKYQPGDLEAAFYGDPNLVEMYERVVKDRINDCPDDEWEAWRDALAQHEIIKQKYN